MEVNNDITSSSNVNTSDAINRSVLVTNISPSASNKTVADFFAFCGNISGLTMRTQSNSAENVQEAIIEFSQEAATKTALLLTNALIIDRPITVTRYTGETSQTNTNTYQNTRVYKESEIDNKPHDLPAGQRSQTSVIASILAAGYQLASGTLEAAKTYDEKYSVTDQLYAGAATVSKAVQDIDQQYSVSATATSWYNAAAAKCAEIDQKYGVSTYTAAGFKTADSTVKSVVEHPSVVAATQSVKGAGDAILHQPIVQGVVDQYNAVVGETQNLIAEKNPNYTAVPTEESASTTTNTALPIDTTPSNTNTLNSTSTSTSTSTTTANDLLSEPVGNQNYTTDKTPLLAHTEINPSSGLGHEAPLEKKN